MHRRTLLVLFLALAFACFAENEGKRKHPRRSRAQRSSETANENYRVSEKFPIHVKGDDEFIKKTEEALCLIKDQAPKSYSMLTNYHFRIQRRKQSGITVESTPPVFYVGNPTFNGALHWYASCIVHDAYHLKLYKDYRKKYGKNVPVTVFTGREPENMCLSAQQVFYSEIKAPGSAERIKYLERMKSVEYYTKRARMERTW